MCVCVWVCGWVGVAEGVEVVEDGGDGGGGGFVFGGGVAVCVCVCV